MTDNRDICERLEDQSVDGAIYLRINASKKIKALRYYVARLEEDLAIADNETERLRKYSSKQALDIVTLGQEVGRLREALEDHVRAAECIRHWHDTLGDEGMVVSAEHVRLLWEATSRARAALAGKEQK